MLNENTIQFKGRVYPKIKCMSLLAVKSFQTCEAFFITWNTKGDIPKSVVKQTIFVAIALHCMGKNTETVLKSPFMFHRIKYVAD